MVLEVVLENLEEIALAEKFGVKRVELCSALDLGGVTPSHSMIASSVLQTTCEVHVMIRPRSGGFIYTDGEVQIMKNDIATAKALGCKGVVFGLLSGNEIDTYNTQLLTDFSKSLSLEVTFHRAIDFTDNIFKSVERLVDIGTTRLLTSGGSKTVDGGISAIKKLYDNFSPEIQIMAGGGVNTANISDLLATNIDAIHFNVRKESVIQSNVLMGLEYELDEDKIENITDKFSDYFKSKNQY